MTSDSPPTKRRKFEALNDAQLRAWIRAGEAIVRADGRGLTFSLSKAGTAVWSLRYRFGGRAREVTLGRYPEMGLALARTEALRLLLEVGKGIDVAIAKQEAKKEAARRWTFERLFDDFLQKRSG
ncbi:MAG TPA: Arm DNA-binding domain-containing protein, partial [Plasticicumulans sp.]|nr:Arm DNA-binding domain-containing protein [Plasticicumulans sp.]